MNYILISNSEGKSESKPTLTYTQKSKNLKEFEQNFIFKKLLNWIFAVFLNEIEPNDSKKILGQMTWSELNLIIPTESIHSHEASILNWSRFGSLHPVTYWDKTCIPHWSIDRTKLKKNCIPWMCTHLIFILVIKSEVHGALLVGGWSASTRGKHSNS